MWPAGKFAYTSPASSLALLHGAIPLSSSSDAHQNCSLALYNIPLIWSDKQGLTSNGFNLEFAASEAIVSFNRPSN